MYDEITPTEILAAAPAVLGDDDLNAHVLVAAALLERATAAVVAAVGEWDARALWALDGAVAPAPWLAQRADMSAREARSLVGAARALRRTTAVASALADGVLNVGQAKALASVRTSRTEELFDTHEGHLVAAAQSLSVDDTIRLARRWKVQADTDGPPPDDDDQTARLSTAYEGRWRLDANLSPEGGMIVKSVLEQIMDELFQAATADATPAGSAQRRRADALVEMARRASTASDDRPCARPLIIIRADLADLESRAGWAVTADGVVMHGDTLRRLMCDADISRVVTRGDSEILDVGRTSRTATAAQRRALTIRDGGCVFPGCDRPPGWCQAHHIQWWERNGPTDLSNLCLLCSRHHHEVHRGRFSIEANPDGTIAFTRADGAHLRPADDPYHPFAAMWVNPPAA